MTSAGARSGFDWPAAAERLSRAAELLADSAGTDADASRRVLEERARNLARATRDATIREDVLSVVVFTLGAERYALEARWLREILRTAEVTPVPGLPDYLVGVANLRGEILAVVDPRRLFGIDAADAAARPRVIVIGEAFAEFGLLADEVDEVTAIPSADVDPASLSAAGPGRELIRGITRDAVVVLDAAALLSDPRLVFDRPKEAGP